MFNGFWESVRYGSKQAMKDYNFCMSAVIINADNISDGLVDVLPMANQYDFSMNEIEMPVIHNVPVVFPNTGKTSIIFPVDQGDGVLLVFTQHDNTDYLNGDKIQKIPMSNSWLSLHHATAFVGFNTINESPFNPNNYKNTLDMSDLNIVHNKKTEKEIVLSLKSDGNVSLKLTDGTIYTESKEVNAKCDVINANSALIKTDNDVEIKGLSVYQNMTQHDHNYTDDGNPMVTSKPNIK